MTQDVFEIHSVKRLSDGETFNVGDMAENTLGSKFKIKTITIDKGELVISGEDPHRIPKLFVTVTSEPNYGVFNKLKKLPSQSSKPEPLFRTEDGKDIFDGDEFYCVYKPDGSIMRGIARTNPKMDGIGKYSTKEEAMCSIPCLSINDVKSVYGKDRSFVGVPYLLNNLKTLAQSKIN